MKKKTCMINHIPIKHVWLEENIILIKDVQKWMDQKMLNCLLKNKLYNISKDQNSKVKLFKKWKGWKNLSNYIKWKTLNHIIIYNLVFSSISSCCICSLCYMTSNVQMVALHLNLNCISNKLFLCYALNLINT